MKTMYGMVLYCALAGGVFAQTNVLTAKPSAGAGLLVATNVSPLTWTSTNITMRAQGAGLQTVVPGKTVEIPKGGGRSTTITATPRGGMTIHEPGNNNLTTITPVSGGLVIGGPKNENIRLSVMPDGSVRTTGSRKKGGTQVVVSPDGKSVTVWTRDGVYTVPVPQK